MGQITNQRLNNFCEGIGDERRTQAASRSHEAALKSGALNEMHRRNIQQYDFAGVTLLREVGSEKLRVRVSKEAEATGNAATAGEPEGVADIERGDREDLERDENPPDDDDQDGGIHDSGDLGDGE